MKKSIELYVAHEVDEQNRPKKLTPRRSQATNYPHTASTSNQVKENQPTFRKQFIPESQNNFDIDSENEPENFPTSYQELMDIRPESPLQWRDLISNYEFDSRDDFDFETKHDATLVEGNNHVIIEEQRSSGEEDDIEHEISSENDASDDEFLDAWEKVVRWKHSKTASIEKITQDILTIHNDVPESEHEESDTNSDTDIEMQLDSETDEEAVAQKKKRVHIPTVNKYTNFKTFLKWCLGMRFPNTVAFKDAVIRYGVAHGYQLRICRNDKGRGGRLGIGCEGGCPFRIYASWEGKRACYVVKTLNPIHKCSRDMQKNRCFKSKWAANEFLEIFKEKPQWLASDIVKAVRQKFGIIIENGVAYKIKYFAHRMLHGSMFEHYSKIGRYLAALKNASSLTDVDLVTVPDPEVPRNPRMFQRLYLCFDALRIGFLNGCRPVLCLDGSFLKTFLGGVLLTAIGRDGNNQMFSVAWAVVESENIDSWEWFMGQLKSSFKGVDGESWTFMSDEHKAILAAVPKLFPKAEQRHCARHIYQHWKRTYKGDELKMHFWNNVKAYNQANYNQALEDMTLVSSEAAEAFKALNPKTFCRTFLKTDSICDIVVNNIAETFNYWIIHARSKHILYMLEDIRSQMMERLCKNRAVMLTWNNICPRVQKELEKEKDEARNCFPSPSAIMVFQVAHELDSLVVDLENKTCTCRKWDLSGIPCCHAVACAFYLRHKAEEYVSEYLKTTTYIKCYTGSIPPCHGERHWPIVNFPMQPAPIRAAPGRPKKKRRKDPFEDPKRPGKLTKHGQKMHCSVCKSAGHTKRTCPNKVDNVIEPTTQRKTVGRPTKNPSSSETTQEFVLHIATATVEPSRKGRGTGTGTGTGTGGAKTRGVIARRSKVPVGYGVYINDQGTTFTNTARQQGPVNITDTTSPLMSNQLSTTEASSSQSRLVS